MELDYKDFENLFGLSRLSDLCKKTVDKYDFSYEELNGKAHDDVVLEILKALDRGFSKTGNIEKWEKGWGENLEKYLKSGNKDDLIPGYYKKNPLRLNGRFILPKDVRFEVNLFDVLRTWIAEEFLQDVNHIYEFGCGPAHNLVALYDMYPDKKYVGLDWATASQKIISSLGIDNISGANFDMFSPSSFDIEPKSAILTIGGLEQVGTRFGPMLEYLLETPASKIIHIEPIIELYEDNLLDWLAMTFTIHRNYLNGYLTQLQKMKDSVELELVKRIRFGSLFHEGWNVVVWHKK